MRIIAGLSMAIGMVVLLVALLASGSALARPMDAVCLVPDDYPSIQSALNEQSCSAISLAAGIFGETIIISRTVTIQGQGRDLTIIDGQGWDTVLDIRPGSQVTVTDLAITGGRNTYVGAIAINASELALRNVAITQNIAVGTPVISGKGGAIYLGQGASVTIENASLSDNEALRGGALYVSEGAAVTVTHSMLTGNLGRDYGNRGFGSAIYNDGAVSLIDTEINDSRLGEGTIFNQGLLIIEGGALQRNERSAIANRVGAITTISGTLLSGNDSYRGGALLNYGTARASLNQVTISNNDASDGGHSGCGIYNSGVLTLTRSLLSGNKCEAVRHDGNILAKTVISQSLIMDNRRGLAVNDAGSVLVEDSIIYRNGDSGGVVVGTFGRWGGDLLIRNSTISGNWRGSGGGIYVDYSPDEPGSFQIENSTISLNAAEWRGGGIASHGGLVSMRNVTVYQNFAKDGSGLFSDSPDAVFSMVNTIVANGGPGTDCDWGGYDPAQRKDVFVSLGHNLGGDSSCELTGAGDLPDRDPSLGPLLFKGGLTPIHGPLPGSPGVDAGDDAHCPAVDQGGVSRPVDGDEDQVAHCDIGAVEFEPFTNHIYLPALLKQKETQ